MVRSRSLLPVNARRYSARARNARGGDVPSADEIVPEGTDGREGEMVDEQASCQSNAG
jgi:hypothetical protein